MLYPYVMPQYVAAMGAGGTGELPSVSIQKPAGTLNIQDTIEVRSGWENLSGTVNALGSTVVFVGTQSVNPGSMVFDDIVLKNKEYVDMIVSDAYTHSNRDAYAHSHPNRHAKSDADG